MINKIIIISLSLLTMLLLTDCTDHEFEQPSNGILPNGNIELTVGYTIPESSSIETKATNDTENLIKNAYLLVFEAPDENRQLDTDRLVRISEFKIGDYESYIGIRFIVQPYAGKCRVKIVANLEQEMRDRLNGFNTLESGSSLSVSTIKDFKTLTSSKEIFYRNKDDYYPLLATTNVLNGINRQTNIEVNLIRTYASIQIVVPSTITDFKITSGYLHNGRKTGRIEPYETGEFPTLSSADFGANELKVYTNGTLPMLFLHENLGSTATVADPTILIVKGTYSKDGNTKEGYYKLHIVYPASGNSNGYNIRRNTRYVVTLKKIKNWGYSTQEEAMRSLPENMPLEYDVSVDELTGSSDILYHSSGYSISASNTEAQIYAAKAGEQYVATTLTFDKTQYVDFIPTRSVSLINGKDITLHNAGDVINAPIGQPVDIKVSFSRPDASGTLEIRFGGLRKLIQINGYKMLRSDKLQVLEFSDILNASYGNADNGSSTWHRISKSAIFPINNEQNITLDSPGKLYFLAQANPTTENRVATPVYLFRANNKGTLKVIATQTYGAAWENDCYYRETADLATKADKRANSILIPNTEIRNYKITGSRVYDYYKTAQPELKADICWADFNLHDPNPFEPHLVIEVENPDKGFQDIRLRVRKYIQNSKNTGQANVIWGLKSGDKWIWTWHIWLTDLVKESGQTGLVYNGTSLSVFASKTELKTVFSNSNGPGGRFPRIQATGQTARTFLDRNMGAKTTAYIPSGAIQINNALNHYGLHYQWGRKDPFPASPYILQPSQTSPSDALIYTPASATGLEFKNDTNRIFKTRDKLTMIESINKPLLFSAADYNDWCSDQSNLSRWNEGATGISKGIKAIYDPSPYGWRLNWGNGNEIYDTPIKKWIIYSDQINNMPGGALVNNVFWFPASGSRDYRSAFYNWLGKCGAYWTGGSYYNTHANVMYFEYNSPENPNTCTFNKDYSILRTYACSVRPVLDE